MNLAATELLYTTACKRPVDGMKRDVLYRSSRLLDIADVSDLLEGACDSTATSHLFMIGG